MIAGGVVVESVGGRRVYEPPDGVPVIDFGVDAPRNCGGRCVYHGAAQEIDCDSGPFQATDWVIGVGAVTVDVPVVPLPLWRPPTCLSHLGPPPL